MTRRLAPCLAVAALTAAGCPDGAGPVGAPGPPAVVERVDHIDLHCSPAAMNWDGRPGPDGIGAQVYCYRLAEPLPVTVGGTLELVLYEGKVAEEQLLTVPAAHTWRFPAGELERYLVRNIIGWHYSIPLRWGRDAPQSDVLTLVARHRAPDGQTVQSRPATVLKGG